MEITFQIKAVDNHFLVVVGPAVLNASEAEQRAAAGPMLVDFGGTFGEEQDEFLLPTRQVSLPDNLPQTVKFSSDELGGAEAAARAAAYRTGIESKIQESLNAWMSFRPSSYEERTVVTLVAQ